VSFFGWLRPRQPLLGWGCKLGVAGLILLAGAAHSKEHPAFQAPVALTELPVEARTVYRAIQAGESFSRAKDGAVFGNREHLLAPKPRGYYREYTVPTPGARDRGARRIVCGGEPPKPPEACFYTGDHYASFRKIAS
jgi:ribonuclease T1